MEQTADHGSLPGYPEVELLQSGFRYALALTRHRHDAEDLAQDAWVNLCRRYGTVGSRATLFTAIRNLFIDRLRRDRLVAFDSLEESPSEMVEAATLLPGTLADLEQLLGRLRPGEREAIYLHYVLGHTAAEISIVTHRSCGTVLCLLHRALKKLRRATSRPG